MSICESCEVMESDKVSTFGSRFISLHIFITQRYLNGALLNFMSHFRSVEYMDSNKFLTNKHFSQVWP